MDSPFWQYYETLAFDAKSVHDRVDVLCRCMQEVFNGRLDHTFLGSRSIDTMFEQGDGGAVVKEFLVRYAADRRIRTWCQDTQIRHYIDAEKWRARYGYA